MSAIITNNFKIQNAINFTREVSNNNYYIAIGKVDDWAEGFDLKPVNSTTTYRSLWDNMIGGKEIATNRISLVVPKINWTEGIIYAMYDDEDTDLYNKNFYVITEDRNVYKCLFNNNDNPSLIKPTGTGTSTIELSDGYVWKYLYTVSLDDLSRFDVDNYIPITNDPVMESPQDIVMRSAIPGTIDTIKVVHEGLGYINPVINISGDGEGAIAQAVMNGTSIEKIKILSPGKNYTYAEIRITSETEPSSVAIVRPIIAPNKGHGSNIVKELYATRVMISADLEYDENGKLPITNDFRIISVINNPTFMNKGEDEPEGEVEEDEEKVSNDTAFSQLTKLTLSAGASLLFKEDSIITGISSGATARVVSIDENNVMSLINVRGKFREQESIQSGDFQSIIEKIEMPDLIRDSGDFVYIDYRRPISRAEDQKEKIRIILQF